MKEYVMKTKIVDVSFKCCSYYGNPSYYITFENGMRGYTASNAACAYGCKNTKYKESAEVTYHFTKKGFMVIDNIR